MMMGQGMFALRLPERIKWVFLLTVISMKAQYNQAKKQSYRFPIKHKNI